MATVLGNIVLGALGDDAGIAVGVYLGFFAINFETVDRGTDGDVDTHRVAFFDSEASTGLLAVGGDERRLYAGGAATSPGEVGELQVRGVARLIDGVADTHLIILIVIARAHSHRR